MSELEERILEMLKNIRCPDQDFAVEDNDFDPLKHPRNPKTGEFVINGLNLIKSANITYKKPLSKYIERYGNKIKAATEFAKKELQTKSVVGKDHRGKKIKVNFNSNSTGKFYANVKKDNFIAELIPYAPEIIAEGKCRYDPLYKDRDDNTQYFLKFSKKIPTSKGNIKVTLGVGIRRNVNQAYSLKYDEKRIKRSEDGLSEAMDNITFEYVVLGIYY